MCITEYDEEKTFEAFRREEREEGRAEGREEGINEIISKLRAVGVPDEKIQAALYSQTMRFSGSDFVKIIYANFYSSSPANLYRLRV